MLTSSKKGFIGSLSGIKFKPDNLLKFYIIIYCVPNVIGFNSLAQPQLFVVWQFISLCMVVFGALWCATKMKTGGTQFIVFSLLLIISKLAVFALDPTGIGINKIYDEFIPVVIAISFLVLLGGTKISPEETTGIIKFYVKFIIFASIYNLILNITNVASFASITDPYQYTFQSFFENRNAYAYLVGLGIVALLYLKSAKSLGRIPFYVVLTLMIVNILLTLSRGGILFAILSSLLFYLLSGGVKKIAMYIISIAAVLFIMVATFGSNFLSENLVRSDAGLTHRDTIQEYGVQFFQENNIVFGSGEAIRVPLKESHDFTSVHSTYVDVLVTGGILKAILYSYLIILVFNAIKEIRRKNKILAAFFLSILLTYLTYSFFETATPFGLSPTSAATTVLIVILPIFVGQYYKQDEKKIRIRK